MRGCLSCFREEVVHHLPCGEGSPPASRKRFFSRYLPSHERAGGYPMLRILKRYDLDLAGAGGDAALHFRLLPHPQADYSFV